MGSGRLWLCGLVRARPSHNPPRNGCWGHHRTDRVDVHASCHPATIQRCDRQRVLLELRRTRVAAALHSPGLDAAAMNPDGAHRVRLYWAGVALGPAAWAINLQTIYAITPHACAKPTLATIFVSIVMALIATLGTLISLRATHRDAPAELVETQGGQARNFMAWLGV